MKDQPILCYLLFTWAELEEISYDLVICMPSTDKSDFFATGRNIKEKYPHIPIVILTPFSHGFRLQRLPV